LALTGGECQPILALGLRECKCPGPDPRPPGTSGVRSPRRPASLTLRAVAEMHDATEEYLETILEIEEEGVTPIRARLVERLGLSAAAVSEQVNRLVGKGYAELLDDRSLRLTGSGRALATSIVRRHRLAERLLVDVIGLEWEKVHREADRWEHAISADVEAKLVELLDDPATCPHGNPIPGSAHPVPTVPTVPLAQAGPGRVRASTAEKCVPTWETWSWVSSRSSRSVNSRSLSNRSRPVSGGSPRSELSMSPPAPMPQMKRPPEISSRASRSRMNDTGCR